MPKKNQHVILHQADLLLRHSSTRTFSFNGFSVSGAIKISEFKYLAGNFRSDFFGILLITNGKAEFKINLQHYSLTKNDLIMIPPSAIKQFVKATKGCTAIGVNFTGHFLNQAGVAKHVSDLFDYFTTKYNPHWRLNSQDAVTIESSMLALELRCRLLPEHPYGKEILYHTFFNFIYEIGAQARKYANASNEQLSRKEDLIMRFGGLVNNHFKSQRSVKYYASLLHVTPNYLTETVKEISGKNAGEIIDDFVMLEAKFLLSDPKVSIAHVAEALNFSNQSFFGKFFKRHTGVSPKTFRRSALI